MGARLVGRRRGVTPAVSLGPKLPRPSAPARSLPASRSLPWRRAWTSPNSEWGGRTLLGLARPRSCLPRPAPTPLSYWTRPGARERGNGPAARLDRSLAQVRGAGGRIWGLGAGLASRPALSPGPSRRASCSVVFQVSSVWPLGDAFPRPFGSSLGLESVAVGRQGERLDVLRAPLF